MTPPVRTDGLTVRYGTATVLRDVSLSIADGEFVALLGANGSGKSTLVKALLGVTPISSGSAEIFGVDVRRRHGAVSWERVGYAPQRVSAAGGIPASAIEVVGSGLLQPRRLFPPRRWRRTAQAALEQVGLGHRGHESVQVFSGGQQQRVLLARALVRDPDLLVLDEPLAGIDHASQVALADTLRRLRDQGRTMILVLHELGTLTDLVSRAVVLRHGRIVHDGPPPRPAPGHDAHDHEHVHPHSGDEAPDHLAPDLRVDL